MAPGHMLLLLVVVVLDVVGRLSVHVGADAAPTCPASDSDALLAFKQGLSDPRKVLATWTPSTSCCRWHGVACDTAGHVTRLTISGRRGLTQNGARPDLIGSTLANLTHLEVLSLSDLSSATPPLNLPRGLESLRKLTTLSLIAGGYSGNIPPEWSRIRSLQNLNLSFNENIEGQIPQSFCSLANLERLGLANSGSPPSAGLTGNIPNCLVDLTNLTAIDLSYNKIAGKLPTSIGNLVNLVSLRLNNNLLRGPIPSSIGNLKSLRALDLHGNKLSGDIPSTIGKLASLEELRLGAEEDINSNNIVSFNRELAGKIPADLGLSGRSLRVLRIRGTSVSGEIPDSLGLNNKLTEILLDDNALTGSIPSSLGLLKKLVTLNLASNQLSGIIPAELGRPKHKLTTISLAHNQLSGQIPVTFSSLTLQTLDLSYNELNGSIPTELGKALPFGTLNLAKNKLTGPFPTSLWNARTIILSHNLLTSLPLGHLPADINSHVQELYVASNQLSGPIPPWVVEFFVIFFIDLSNNKLVSPLPAIDVNEFSVSYINISRNLFTGTIPEEWGNLRGLNTLDFSFNQFSGSIPSNFSSGSTFLNNLILSHNHLSGPLPNATFSSEFYNSLDLSHNHLSGSIPNIFPNSTPFLSFLDLSYNQLSGSIPPKLFTYSDYIAKVKLDHNQFTGSIPDLGDACNKGLTNLNFVTLNDNQLTGSLHEASWIPRCAQRFSVFDISGNFIEGAIPDFSSWTNIQVLNLARNKLTGTIPTYLFTSVPSLRVLDLSNNALEGPAPFEQAGGLSAIINGSGANLEPVEEGGSYYRDGIVYTQDGFIQSFTFTLSTTTAIDLSHNQLSGTLAPEVGVLQGLRALNLATNRFTGTLPTSLGALPLLKVIDLSNNAFIGRIPFGLQKFPARSFVGNPGLCGRPLRTNCH